MKATSFIIVVLICIIFGLMIVKPTQTTPKFNFDSPDLKRYMSQLQEEFPNDHGYMMIEFTNGEYDNYTVQIFPDYRACKSQLDHDVKVFGFDKDRYGCAKL